MTVNRTNKVVYLGLMVGIAMGLHIFESLIPIPTPVPGAKLGLANIAALYVIIRFGYKEAVAVTIVRTFGSMFGAGLLHLLFLSFFGGLTSTLVMGICYQLWSKHFRVSGLSTLGAFTHNTTQLAVACFMYEQIGFFYLLPYLLFFAIPTGFFVGIVTQQLVKKIRI